MCNISTYDDDNNNYLTDDTYYGLYEYASLGGDRCWDPGYTYFLEEYISLTYEEMRNTYSNYIASKSSVVGVSSSSSDTGFLTTSVVVGGSVLLVSAGVVVALAMTIFKSKNSPSFQTLPDSSEHATAASTSMFNAVELEAMPSKHGEAACQL